MQYPDGQTCRKPITLSATEEKNLAAPLITLLTDFGLDDGYVASMKGVILGICPDAQIVDITHLIAPQRVRSAAFVLFTAYEHFPRGTIHLAVVDPGVGTERKAIAIRTRSAYFVGPDNGVFSLVLAAEEKWEARSLDNPRFRREPVSRTFHGRDLFAPVSAHLARGTAFERLGAPCTPLVDSWSAPEVFEGRIEGEVIHIDHFGNAITNVSRRSLEALGPMERWVLRTGETVLPAILQTYGEARAGEALGLAGSSGFIEIAVNRGHAASVLGIGPGTQVTFLLR